MFVLVIHTHAQSPPMQFYFYPWEPPGSTELSALYSLTCPLIMWMLPNLPGKQEHICVPNLNARVELWFPENVCENIRHKKKICHNKKKSIQKIKDLSGNFQCLQRSHDLVSERKFTAQTSGFTLWAAKPREAQKLSEWSPRLRNVTQPSVCAISLQQ